MNLKDKNTITTFSIDESLIRRRCQMNYTTARLFFKLFFLVSLFVFLTRTNTTLANPINYNEQHDGDLIYLSGLPMFQSAFLVADAGNNIINGSGTWAVDATGHSIDFDFAPIRIPTGFQLDSASFSANTNSEFNYITQIHLMLVGFQDTDNDGSYSEYNPINNQWVSVSPGQYVFPVNMPVTDGDYGFVISGYSGGIGQGQYQDFDYTWQLMVSETGSIYPVPEPATILCLVSGLIGLAGLKRGFWKK
jgi:hypothetical protein